KPFRRESDWSLSHRNAFRLASAFHCVTLDGCCFLFTRYWFRQRLEQNCFCSNRCRIRPNLPLQMSQRGVDFMGLRLVSLLVIGALPRQPGSMRKDYRPLYREQFLHRKRCCNLLYQPYLLGLVCLVPDFDGASSSHDSKEALWDKFYTAAPLRPRQSV